MSDIQVGDKVAFDWYGKAKIGFIEKLSSRKAVACVMVQEDGQSKKYVLATMWGDAPRLTVIPVSLASLAYDSDSVQPVLGGGE